MLNKFEIFERDMFFKIKEIEAAMESEYHGCFYVLEYESTVSKIGCSQNPHKRIMDLCRSAELYGNRKINRAAISVRHTNYRKNEAYLHRFFSESRKAGTELFKLPFDYILQNLPRDLVYENRSEEKRAKAEATCEALAELAFGTLPRRLKEEYSNIDMLEAAQIVADCPEENLPLVLAILRAGGIDIPNVEGNVEK